MRSLASAITLWVLMAGMFWTTMVSANARGIKKIISIGSIEMQFQFSIE